MDCMASWISCIQVLRSSFELARTSIISGFSMPAVMRKRPRSLLATSLTISFWREMTVERWSCRGEGEEEQGRGRSVKGGERKRGREGGGHDEKQREEGYRRERGGREIIAELGEGKGGE